MSRPNEQVYYSKLAVIELSGWIECYVDDLCMFSMRQKTRVSAYHSDLEKKMKRVYGLTYNDHVRRLLITTIGVYSVNKLEAKVGLRNITTLKSELSLLSELRNDLAHNYTSPAFPCPAPSVTIQKMNIIAPILSKIKKQISTL